MNSVKDAGREFWDANPCGGEWASYAAFLDWYRRTEPYMFTVVDELQWQGQRVLEVGCGQGPLVNHLAQRGAVPTGLDVSAGSLRRARFGAAELGLRGVTLLQSDAERLPFGDNSFDRVVSFGVLHHTPDTQGAVNELYRVLKPGGLAIVMLYRTGNPKWWATRLLRRWGRWRDASDRPEASVNDAKGTALLELFGVPTLKAFSNRESRQMFRAFSGVRIRNVQPGFARLADIRPELRPLRGALAVIDRVSQSRWGFYQVIEGRKDIRR